MKTYRFPLESVLELRRKEQDLAEAEFAEALGREASAWLQVMEAKAAMETQFGTLERLDRSGACAAVRAREWTIQTYQAREVNNLAAIATNCAEEVHLKRAALVAAKRRCELLTRLKERRANDFRAKEQHLMEAEISDFAIRNAALRLKEDKHHVEQ